MGWLGGRCWFLTSNDVQLGTYWVMPVGRRCQCRCPLLQHPIPVCLLFHSPLSVVFNRSPSLPFIGTNPMTLTRSIPNRAAVAYLTLPATASTQIPVSSINIGPINKKDVMRANAMIERGYKKFGVILAFDVPGECMLQGAMHLQLM